MHAAARRVGRWLAAGALVTLIALLAAPSAGAFTCLWAGGTVTLSVMDEFVRVERTAAGTITANGADCGGTVTNTDEVVVTGQLSNVALFIDLGMGPFAPGAVAEATGVSEIEFDLGGLAFFPGSALVILATSGPDAITAGAAGINLNGDDDADVFLPGGSIDTIYLGGQGGDDTISTTGGNGTGGGTAGQRFHLNGGPGNDVLSALDGEVGPGSGGDLLEGGLGDDTMFGDNADAVYFANAPSGGTIDLGAGTASTGDGSDSFTGIPNVFATLFDDVIVGSALPNVIFALDGDDVVAAGGGQDTVDGGVGNDRLDAQGVGDTVTGGPGDDVIVQIFGTAGPGSVLDGGPGNDRFEIAFGSSGGTISIAEAPGGGNDELVVSCVPEGGVVSTPAGPGAGSIARGPETLAYTAVEALTIPPECVSGDGGGGGGGGGSNPSHRPNPALLRRDPSPRSRGTGASSPQPSATALRFASTVRRASSRAATMRSSRSCGAGGSSHRRGHRTSSRRRC